MAQTVLEAQACAANAPTIDGNGIRHNRSKVRNRVYHTPKNFVDLTGQRFGKLVVIRRVENHGKRPAWLCKCDCGNQLEVIGESLRSGNTKTCGCSRESHGCADDRLYSVWCTMKARCNNPNKNNYASYGARGIVVCDEWLNSFTAFRNWALENGYDYDAPYGKCTIDRIDVDGNYCPENCRWVDAEIQARNRRNIPRVKRGIEVDYKGKHYLSLSALAREYGFHSSRLERRIHRMTIDEAMDEILASIGSAGG